ncbi:mRNA splicing factor RNA helicase [Niveomyces insectorum RCEF 264]|uniref:mRNA splicing factor RNA helicase n=1 Tax=Niveomyces insectorum RCEF 264 TaxID=1081102 RepID=A0A167PEG8_9HYPO|nr:mRNA splicing factor RNA helicase [Niveomyces insectorum RCEF 264]
MEDTSADTSTPIPVLFGRPGKKRKIYRQRPETAAEEPSASPAATEDGAKADDATTPALPQPVTRLGGSEGDTIKDDDGGGDSGSASDGDGNASEDDAVELTVAALIRRRKARRQKLGGVEFRVGEEGGSHSSADRSLALRTGGDFDLDEAGMDMDFSSEPIPVGLRFAPQTGLIGELVNKHMEEYVDAQMAKRYKEHASSQADAQHPGQHHHDGTDPNGDPSGASSTSTKAREQLAMKGKLHEIDLGAEARARNIAMTEWATRRLRDADDAGREGTGLAADARGGDVVSARFGRDGKPSQRQRRGSDDVKRDQLVEQFLHENKMDVDMYDVAARDAAPVTTEGRPTDDRIAEQFRREFMEAVAQRMRRKRKPLGPPAKPKVRNEEEILRGPKLGGSRNVRSVMRDKLLQKQEEERQNMPKYEQQLQEQRRRANRRR